MRWLTHPEESLLAVSLPQLAGLELPYLGTPLVQADGLLTPQGCGVLAGVGNISNQAEEIQILSCMLEFERMML
eukprot:1159183-Pelagomonas_calceolata.AAC.3